MKFGLKMLDGRLITSDTNVTRNKRKFDKLIIKAKPIDQGFDCMNKRE